MKLELFYPSKPFVVTQAFGIKNPIYLQAGLPFSQHNGIDVALGADKTIYAPFDCTVVKTFSQSLGGNVLTVVSKNVYDFPDGVSCYVKIDFLHLESFIASPWQNKGVGEKLAIADNTGELTTGPHTHAQFRRIDIWGNDIDKNEANNSFNPSPYWTGIYAQDYWTILAQLGLIRLRLLSIKEQLAKGRNTY